MLFNSGSASINSPRAKVIAAHEAAFKDTVMLFMRKCTEVISSPRLWAGYGDVRDIVDTGQLRASVKIDFPRASGVDLEAELSWLTEYAAAVHNGAVIRYKNGNTRTIPAREWTKIALQDFNFLDTYRRLFDVYVNR